jgi:formylglycine-generating enzyme required for sulfatase activity
MLLGFGCAAIVVFAAVALGVLSIDTSGTGIAGRSTPTEIIVTATPNPLEPTATPVIITATPVPVTPTIAVVQVVAPTATPLPPTQDTSVKVQPSATATLSLPPTQQAVPVGQGNTIPADLAQILSPMAKVDGGTFKMGTTPAEISRAVDDCKRRDNGGCDISFGQDSQPVHDVTVDPFQMDITEVTNQQYITFLNWERHSSGGRWSHKNGCDGQPCIATRNDAGGENSNIIFDSANYDVNPAIASLPMVSVTWYGAKAYCEAIGRRLPTEAEWERAARDGDERIYPWGNDWNAANAKTNRPKDVPIGPVQVGTLRGGVSPYGVYDLAGNVAEWVSDWYSPNFYSQPEASQPNPKGPPAGTTKVVRGGSWDAVPFFSRSVHRQDRQPNDQTLWIGFRCAADNNATQPVTAGSTTAGGTPNPATLGVITPGSEENTTASDNAAPTIPPAPTKALPANVTPSAIPTLPPGG